MDLTGPKRLLRQAGPLLGVALFTVALWVLRRELHAYHYHDIIRELETVPAQRIVAAIILTALNYLVLTGYEQLAFRAIRHPLRYSRVAMTSFIGYAFSNAVGFSMISGSSIRYRLYSAWGLCASEIVQILTFITVTFWLGLLALTGMMLIIDAPTIPAGLRLGLSSTRPIGVACCLLSAGYLAWSAWFRRPIKLLNWELTIPPLKYSIAQTLISAADLALAAGALYVLLPARAGISYGAFLSLYAVALLAGTASQVPGGLGVFESIILVSLSPRLSGPEVVSALVVYRLVYYVLPLAVACLLLGAHEIMERREGIQRAARVFGDWAPDAVPNLLAAAAFIGGAVLLFSGATPAVSGRLAWLRQIVPLPVIEVSHFLGSVVGAGLLVLAWGLQRRLDAAYLLSVVGLGAGIVVSLLKGLDYEEAAILLVMLLGLLPARRSFYRKASLLGEPFSPGWMAAAGLVVGCAIWLGFFSYKHVEYSRELWWRFTVSDDAPRFLRSLVGMIGVVLLAAMARLLRPARGRPSRPTPAELDDASRVLAQAPATYGALALVGDKALLFNDTRTTFIMYAVEGRSWVALGDPVGPRADAAELAWKFRELADRYDGWTVFYDVGRDQLPLYLDLGLTLTKTGEEARVPLADLSFEGGRQKDLRYMHRRLEKIGCRVEVLAPEQVDPMLPSLRRISDAWLASKRTREKGFSLGCFNETYLCRSVVAVVMKDAAPVAFANLWASAGREELSVDLMRYASEAPPGVMDYLFVELMLWGQREGYRVFNLGIAPLSGLQDRTLAPLWNRLGALLFRHGEHFYNFQGLREYKEKFNPLWEPKYLASPGGLVLPRVLTDLATLISGSLRGMVMK